MIIYLEHLIIHSLQKKTWRITILDLRNLQQILDFYNLLISKECSFQAFLSFKGKIVFPEKISKENSNYVQIFNFSLPSPIMALYGSGTGFGSGS
jgi:hypothetical protein